MTIEQGSPEWFAQRLGKVTASRVSDVIAKTRSGYSASRENYMTELALERITGKRQEAYTNEAMKWGTETEPLARAAYEAQAGVFVREVAMIDHPSIAMAGASPDGLIGHDGTLEIKCPNSATHLKTALSGKPDQRYIAQMQWQLACTGRAWADFVSFDPRMPEHMRLFVVRVPRDEAFIAELEQEVTAFLQELESMVNKIELYKAAA